MDFEFLNKLTAPKKADPSQVRKKQMRSKNININFKAIIITFAVLIVLLCSVSALIIIKEHKSVNQVVVDNEQSENNFNSTSLSDSAQSLENANLLLGFTQKGTEGLRLLCLMNFDSVNLNLKVRFIQINTQCTVNNYKGDMSEHMQNGGITELLWAVGEYTGESVEKYIYCDESQFIDIMKYIGQTDITVTKQIISDYNGVSFIIEKGVHKFTADLMLKYFIYLCENYKDNQEEIISLFSRFSYLLIDSNDSLSLFDKYNFIVNYVQTDISAMDISLYQNIILKFSESGSVNKIEIDNKND